MADSATKRLRLEMSEEMLNRLLTTGQVCAADFRCLDCESKQCLWRLCLESCATNLTISELIRGDILRKFGKSCHESD